MAPRWTLWLWLASCACIVSCQSINSPRQQGSLQPDPEEAPDGGTKSDVFVRLPADVQSVLDLQKSDRARIHASILGEGSWKAATLFGNRSYID